jgi:catechol 2,3-dioxygenase-like lactoylglutathione lyase family enzyme
VFNPRTPLRIARPTRSLDAAERFWTEGVGLSVLWRTPEDRDEPHALVMVGIPTAAWHLELVADAPGRPGTTPAPTPTDEDLVVLYLGAPVEDALVARIVEAGGRVVPAANPYWDTWGVTIEDPDGYRLVLCHRTWD